MTSPQPTGVIELFVLQASDYIEQIDAVLNAAGSQGADGDALARGARMLRGSATMTRVPGVAEIAAGIERIGRALREGTLGWEPGLRAALTAAVDDLKILVRGARHWGPAEDQRAQGRSSELARYAPHLARANTPTVAAGGGAFLANEAAEIAVGLDQLVQHPGDAMLLGAVLARVRGLRGVAATRDLPPLADVVDALERAGKPLELSATPAPTPAQLALFQAAGALLRRAAIELRSVGRPDPASPEVHRFTAASAALDESMGDADSIVPIAELFFADGGPHLVSAAPNPPTTPAQRFRLEAVSQAEHLLRLVSEAQVAADPAGRDRLSRELRGAMRALGSAAESFGERDVAGWVGAVAPGVVALEPGTLAAVRQVAALLADSRSTAEQLRHQLSRLNAGAAAAPMAAPSPMPAPAAPAPGGAFAGLPPAPPRRPSNGARTTRTPTGRDLAALLDTGINALGRQLSQRPLSAAVPIVDESLVPIETLLYRGRAALDRAIALRNELRGGARNPSGDELAELYDLLELAATE
ncbi:MAG TPA: Hpt domain-containing protein [Gemmatimonadaceae bacterium]|nr:Hpt domain-containing protein [Gemmatimonadaceae bacterium]